MTRTRTKRLPFAPLAVVILSVIGVSVAEAARCHTFVDFYNVQRRVPGPVNTECGTGTEGMHTPPFGNWGVESPHGAKRNGRQFPGWEAEDDLRWRQWNSCTSDPRFRTSAYLPHGEPQQAIPDVASRYASRVEKGPDNVPCDTVHRGGLRVFGGLYMKIYELDTIADRTVGGNGSDLVGFLSYPTALVPISCSTSSDCRGQSPHYSPLSSSSSNVSANIFVDVHTSYE